MRKQETGRCEHCAKEFGYYLIHNGFNDTCYAYCDSCGQPAFLSHYDKRLPASMRVFGEIDKETEDLLRPCECGGRFKKGAQPRCPHCHGELSAVSATDWIEKNAPGTAKGWHWQRRWSGLYAIVIERRRVEDNFAGELPS